MTKAKSQEATAANSDAGSRFGADGDEDALADYVPKTELGRELLEIRRRIVASGQWLLTREEVEQEVANRRAEMWDAPDDDR